MFAGRALSEEIPWSLLSILLPAVCVVFCATGASPDLWGNQFIGFDNFRRFTASNAATETILLSPEIVPHLQWNQLIVSWNADTPKNAYLKIEARAIFPEHTTKFYTLGLWSGDPSRRPRQSVPNQKDSDGDVATDTLVLNQPGPRLQLRLTLGGEDGEKPKLNFIGIALTDSKVRPRELAPNRKAWGQLLPVPERSQMAYPNGKELCSPTTVSMVLSYWAEKLERPELAHDVPEIVKEVFDPNWQGTGNWPFNTAYAGSLPGLRAYVTRLSDLSEVEDWIAAGLPVALSIDYNKLRGIEGPPSGHLVVCAGFTEQGDVLLNDPGTTLHVRKVFPRQNVIAAWANSRNAVYLIYPKNARVPKDRFGHWDSRASRRARQFATAINN